MEFSKTLTTREHNISKLCTVFTFPFPFRTIPQSGFEVRYFTSEHTLCHDDRGLECLPCLWYACVTCEQASCDSTSNRAWTVLWKSAGDGFVAVAAYLFENSFLHW